MRLISKFLDENGDTLKVVKPTLRIFDGNSKIGEYKLKKGVDGLYYREVQLEPGSYMAEYSGKCKGELLSGFETVAVPKTPEKIDLTDDFSEIITTGMTNQKELCATVKELGVVLNKENNTSKAEITGLLEKIDSKADSTQNEIDHNRRSIDLVKQDLSDRLDGIRTKIGENTDKSHEIVEYIRESNKNSIQKVRQEIKKLKPAKKRITVYNLEDLQKTLKKVSGKKNVRFIKKIVSDDAGMDLQKEFWSEAAKAIVDGALFTDFKGLTFVQEKSVKQILVRSFLAGGAELELAKLKKKLVNIGLDKDRAETIARTELTSVANKAREIGFTKRDPEGKFKYFWLGPQDNRSSQVCKDIKKWIASEGGGVSLKRLKHIVKTVSMKHNGPKWVYRDLMPHINCRHTIQRKF